MAINKQKKKKKKASIVYFQTYNQKKLRVDSLFKEVTARLKSFNITISYLLLLFRCDQVIQVNFVRFNNFCFFFFNY